MESTNKSSRRRFLGNTAAIGAIGAIGASQLIKSCSTSPEASTGTVTEPTILPVAIDGKPLRAGVVGCGGRGSGAALDFLNAGPNLSIVAIADVFQDRIDDIRKTLKDKKDVELADANCFVGFDAYKRLLEVDLDIVILATPPFFRPEHFQACVEARKHVFCEKPVAVDPVGARAVMAASKQAEAAGLCVVTGTQRRHSWNYQNVLARINAGMMGDIVSTNVYWNQNKLWHREKQPDWTEMEFMIRDWVNWTWLSGDHIVEQHVHNIDVSNWFVGGHPVSAMGMGSRLRRPTGDCYDNFAVDFVYDKEIHMNSQCRQINDCANSVSEQIRGTKGYSDGEGTIWSPEGEVLYSWESPVDAAGEKIQNSPYVQEHIDLVTAIREGNQIVEAEETAISVLTAIMGRESAYTGKKVTWEEMMGSDMVLGPQGELAMGPVDIKAVIPIAGSAPE
ncbi:MAG: Gfo/Idh/MocA family oxidoreductase [Bacteroidia bacterium]|nr:MAG: Gfo/Idh/MocA family oxidoreductase [Bacteroidia bacterium]